MSIEVMNLAFYVGGLSPAQKAVLVALANYASPDGGQAFPSVERMVFMTSYAERTVRRALKDLRGMGLIKVDRESKYHSTTEYRLDLSQMQALQDRPARDAPHDLPENTEDLPESANRPARDAPNPSYNQNNNRHNEPSFYSEILSEWAKFFPDKPQPRSNNKTLKGKVNTRMKSAHFEENWREALERASHSGFLKTGSWFDLGWFLHNDSNYEKCLNGKYDDRPSNGHRGKKSKAQMNFEAAEAVKNELKRG